LTKQPRSLEWRITTAIVGVLGVSLAGFSLVLDAAFERALWHQFDARLAETAQAVAGMVEEHGDEPWEVETSGIEDFNRTHGFAYFQVWKDDGSLLARSPSLGKHDLPRGSQDGLVADTRLPDGQAGRVLGASLLPRSDTDLTSKRRVTVAVARQTKDVRAALATLRMLLAALGFTGLVLATVAAVLAVRSGLTPLHRLSSKIDLLGADRLEQRLELGDLPHELKPFVAKLNELLSRLATSFARERQFSADVSHELRTPLAGLRSILEVTLSRERAATEYQNSAHEALAIVRQMTTLVENLLMLAQLEAGALTTTRESLDLHRLVEQSLEPFTAKAHTRGLQVENRIPQGTQFDSDGEKLRIVVNNLIANAVEYTHQGGAITADAEPSRGLVLEVRNSGPALPDAALENIFDRFVRLDTARSGSGEHLGIGLALVKSLCVALGLKVTAHNLPDGWVAFRVEAAGA
jgi:heavy metal sensor kinase